MLPKTTRIYFDITGKKKYIAFSFKLFRMWNNICAKTVRTNKKVVVNFHLHIYNSGCFRIYGNEFSVNLIIVRTVKKNILYGTLK